MTIAEDGAIPVSRKPVALGLRELVNEIWSSCSGSRLFAYAFFALIYIVPNVVLARRKLFWDDEFFTLYLSRTAGWKDLWRALQTGADQHPPSFYYLTHLILKVTGTSHVALRSPALFGFALTCVCLYEIVKRLLGARWAVCAMVIPMASPVLYYATEARGYGLELGFVTFSLLTWLLADEGIQRRYTTPALGLGLCLAVACHYYAVLFVLPIAAAEAVKLVRRRSLDVPVVLALLGALVPLIAFLPLIAKARTYSTHFWAVPAPGSMLEWYRETLGRMPLILLAAAGTAVLLRLVRSETGGTRGERLLSPEIRTAICTCALLPVAGGVIAEFVTHAFTGRYFIAAVPGVVILTVWGLRRILPGETVGPAIATGICLLLAGQQWRDLAADQAGALRQIRSVAALLRSSGEAPIVVTEVSVFHQISFYARRDLARRMVYLADPQLSIQYIGHDTIDRGLLDLVQWFPLRIVWWDEWWRTHDSSLVYGYIGSWSWPTFELHHVGTVQLLRRDVDHLLFFVARTHVPTPDRTSADPSGRPLLYDRLPQSTTRPLCTAYMAVDACLVVDDPKFANPIISYPEILRSR
jgi:hypothetical protein